MFGISQVRIWNPSAPNDHRAKTDFLPESVGIPKRSSHGDAGPKASTANGRWISPCIVNQERYNPLRQRDICFLISNMKKDPNIVVWFCTAVLSTWMRPRDSSLVAGVISLALRWGLMNGLSSNIKKAHAENARFITDTPSKIP